MLERKWFGDKTGQGFYGRQGAEGRGAAGAGLSTLEYRAAQKPKFPALDMAKQVESLPERIRALLGGESGEGQGGGVLLADSRRTCGCTRPTASAKSATALPTSIARCAPDSTGSWGRLRCGTRRGLRETAARLRDQGRKLPPALEKLLAAAERRGTRTRAEYFDPRYGHVCAGRAGHRRW